MLRHRSRAPPHVASVAPVRLTQHMRREKTGAEEILEFPDATIRLSRVLRLSNRGRYALKAVFDLALHAGAPVQVRDVAARQRIPLRFLEQIFQLLKRGGLVESKRGPRGGFLLSREPDEVK